MPICTLRQKVANIELRKKYERLHIQKIAEWQTRTTVQFIAASVPVEKGQKNPLIAEAEKVMLRMEDEAGKSPSDAPPEVFVEQGSQVASNPAGSYEALMRGFA